jgi:hypothetical protein
MHCTTSMAPSLSEANATHIILPNNGLRSSDNLTVEHDKQTGLNNICVILVIQLDALSYTSGTLLEPAAQSTTSILTSVYLRHNAQLTLEYLKPNSRNEMQNQNETSRAETFQGADPEAQHQHEIVKVVHSFSHIHST